VILRLNEFVKGKLFIEHMADFPIKVIPPKMKQIGKEIKVRVFYVDSEDRDLEFTKKETLLKAKTPVY
jgi:ribosomal protein S1